MFQGQGQQAQRKRELIPSGGANHRESSTLLLYNVECPSISEWQWHTVNVHLQLQHERIGGGVVLWVRSPRNECFAKW